MYYVRLEVNLPGGGNMRVGSSVTEDWNKAVSQLLVYREYAENLVASEMIVWYDLFMGTCSTVGKL